MSRAEYSSHTLHKDIVNCYNLVAGKKRTSTNTFLYLCIHSFVCIFLFMTGVLNLSTSAFWDRSFFVVEPVLHVTECSPASLASTPYTTVAFPHPPLGQLQSLHCQMSPGDKTVPGLEPLLYHINPRVTFICSIPQ